MKKILSVGIVISILWIHVIHFYALSVTEGSNQNTDKSVFRGLNYHFEQQSNTLWLRIRNVSGFRTMILENPNRIVVDINDMVGSHKMETIDFDLSFVKRVRYAQIDRETANQGRLNPDTFRLVLDVEEKVIFDIEKNHRDLIIKVKGNTITRVKDFVDTRVSRGGNGRGNEASGEIPTHHKAKENEEDSAFDSTDKIKQNDQLDNQEDHQEIHDKITEKLHGTKIMGNLSYQNTGERVTLLIKGGNLTSGRKELIRSYSGKYDELEKKFIITFENHLAKLEPGTWTIGDGVVESVNVLKDSRNTRIIIHATEKFGYHVFTRPSEKDTAITLLKPAKNSENLVVIDPGHGGRDPGAIADGITEAELNLDIALRLNKLLQEKDIKTYLLREDDSFLDLYERASIANHLNATLFLSIHNNAALSKVAKGTETLYFESKSSKFNGKDFATILQKEMVRVLGTTNRGIVNRQNLVVLRETKMPAALVEIAFMSNPEDMAKLKNEDFLQKSAESLRDGILEALGKI
jgi:N-acetylmuramoyl-L-alanine amidase